MWLGHLPVMQHWVDIQLTDRDGIAPCSLTAGGCRLLSTFIRFTDGEIQNNVLTAEGNESANGLLDVPLLGTRRSRLKITFPDLFPDGRPLQWNLRFNSIMYSGLYGIQRHENGSVHVGVRTRTE